MRFIPAACALLLAATDLHAGVDPALREDGVLYFEDNLPNRVIGTIKTPTVLYLRRDFQMPLASLFAGQKIEIVGVSPEGYLVTGTYRNNSVSGWIMPGNLPPDIDPALLAEAQKNQARRDQIASVIAKKQVIRGMTQDEVHRSLGDPEQTSSRTDDQGTSLIWTYTTYQNVYQTSWVNTGPFARPVLQSYLVRVPSGQLIVTFAGGTVSTIEQQATTSPQGLPADGLN